MTDFIRIRPARAQRVALARWAVAQTPKVRTRSQSEFAVPPHLYVHMPEELLIGSLVDGHRYVPVDDDQPHEQEQEQELEQELEEGEGRELLGVDSPQLLQAIPGDPLPDVPPSAYGPDSVPLPPPDSAPLEDSPVPGEHQEPGEPEGLPYACPLCPRSFATARGLEVHRRRAHREA